MALVDVDPEVEDAPRGDRVVVLCRGAGAWAGPPGSLPLDGGTLARWGLSPPDLTRLGATLFPGEERFWSPGELAEKVCRSG